MDRKGPNRRFFQDRLKAGIAVNQPDRSALLGVDDQFGAKSVFYFGLVMAHIVKVTVWHADINPGKMRIHGELFAQIALQHVDPVGLIADDIGSEQSFGQSGRPLGVQQVALGLFQGQVGNIHHDVPGVPVEHLLGVQIRRGGRDQMGSPDQAQKTENQCPADGSFTFHWVRAYLWM